MPFEARKENLRFQGDLTREVHRAPGIPDVHTLWSERLAAHSRDLLCIHNLEGRLLWVNPAPASQLGYTAAELVRVPMRELIPAGYRELFDEYLEKVAREGTASGLMRILSRSGEERIWEYHNTLHREDANEAVVYGIAQDVTERLLAEKALRQAHDKLGETYRNQGLLQQDLLLFRALLDNANDAIEVIDPQTWRLLDFNEKECSELGFTRTELLGMTIFDIDPDITPESVASNLAEVRRSGFLVLESRHRRKDGSTFPVEMNIKQVQLDREYIVTVSRDITNRKLARSGCGRARSGCAWRMRLRKWACLSATCRLADRAGPPKWPKCMEFRWRVPRYRSKISSSSFIPTTARS